MNQRQTIIGHGYIQNQTAGRQSHEKFDSGNLVLNEKPKLNRYAEHSNLGHNMSQIVQNNGLLESFDENAFKNLKN
jgi:hypothetical protein